MKYKKINQEYWSFFEYLAKNKVLFAHKLNHYFYPTPRLRHNPPFSGDKGQLLGGLQPLLDIKNDIYNSFKPYKSMYHFRKDLFQPLYGIANIIRGAANLAIVPLVFIGNAMYCGYQANKIAKRFYRRSTFRRLKGLCKIFKQLMLGHVNRTISWLIDGTCSLLQGIVQIISSPLVWLGKLPIRSFISVIKGAPKIEDDLEIQNLAIEGLDACFNHEKNSQKTDDKKDILHSKFLISLKKGEATNIDKIKEKKVYERHDTSNYFSLFCPKEKIPLKRKSIFRVSISAKNRSNKLELADSFKINTSP